MSEKIKIVGADCHNAFHFYVDSAKYRKLLGTFCESCESMLLSPVYVYIIRKLKEAELLQKDYPLLCCNCYQKRIFVLKGIKDAKNN